MYDLTRVPELLVTLPGEVAEADKKVEQTAEEKDRLEHELDITQAKIALSEQANGASIEKSKAIAKIETEELAFKVITAKTEYRAARSERDHLNNKLMTMRQLKRDVERMQD